MRASQVAYCTNVHAGPDWPSAVENLKQYTLKVRQELVGAGAWKAEEPMGVGLWLAEPAAQFACSSAATDKSSLRPLEQLRDWLSANQLVPFTMNGFPQGNFHQAIVKHRVYEPTWWEASRREYTLSLISILDQLLPTGLHGSISTLPISWGSPTPTKEQLREAAANLCLVADHLDRLFQQTGRAIVLAIEPEPGCYLTDNASMRQFFTEYLFADDAKSNMRRKYLTVCHDVCHSAVMREDQAEQFSQHRSAGIRIGKVQVSSAIHIDWDPMNATQKMDTFEHLRGFAEDRYLHQTSVRNGKGAAVLHEDLPQLLSSITDPSSLAGSWRVHFHVPIFYNAQTSSDENSKLVDNTFTMSAESQGISTTQSEILRCIEELEKTDAALTTEQASHNFLTDFFTGHYEVETYAWTVLPPAMRQSSLVADIAREMAFFKKCLR